VARLQATGVPFSLIRGTLTNPPGRTLMFVDTCHAGNVVGSARQRLDNTEAINELASSENNIVVFASSAGAQESIEDAKWGNGASPRRCSKGCAARPTSRNVAASPTSSSTPTSRTASMN